MPLRKKNPSKVSKPNASHLKHKVISHESLSEPDDGQVDHMDMLVKHCRKRFPSTQVHVFRPLFFLHLIKTGWDAVKVASSRLRSDAVKGIFSRDFLLVPALDATSKTWWLAVVCYPASAGEGGHQTSIVCLDPGCESTPGGKQPALKALKQYLAKEWTECFGSSLVPYNVRNVTTKSADVPHATRPCDTGAYVLEIARTLLRRTTCMEALARGESVQLSFRRKLQSWWSSLAARLAAAEKERGSQSLKRGAARKQQLNRVRDRRADQELQSSQPRLDSGHTAATSPTQSPKRMQLALSSRASPEQLRPAASPELPAPKAASAVVPDIHAGPVVLWFSRAAEEKVSLAKREALIKMGAETSEDGEGATHLVILGPLRRTLRVMCAICRGLHVVYLGWLSASLRAGHWACEEDFTPSPAFGWHPAEAISAARRRPLLLGWTVHLHRSVAARPELRSLVLAAGGRLLRDRLPDWRLLDAGRLIVLHEKHLDGDDEAPPLSLLPEQLYEGCMLQRLDLPELTG